MSQVGFTPIQLYYSTTASAAPAAGNLANGELAINITDGRLFYKDNGGTVRVLAGTGGSGVVAGSNTQVQFNNNGVFGASANMVFNGTRLTVADLADSGLTSGRVVYASTGGALVDSANLTFDGTNLGVGTTANPGTSRLHVYKGGGEIARFSSYNGSSAYIAVGRDDSTAEGFLLGYNSSNGDCNIAAVAAAHPIVFRRGGIAGTENGRFDGSGNLLVGQTVNGPVNSNSQSQGGGAYVANHVSGSASGNYYAIWNYNAGAIGSITQAGTTGVLYNTTSDQRLKENIQDAASASALIDALQVRQFDWKTDNTHQRYGFIAQELVNVAPEAVNQPADPDDMMAVDYSKLVPMLVKEIQSLRQRLSALESK
jgi:hypothetical protein